jgi:hypothetical protein
MWEKINIHKINSCNTQKSSRHQAQLTDFLLGNKLTATKLLLSCFKLASEPIWFYANSYSVCCTPAGYLSTVIILNGLKRKSVQGGQGDLLPAEEAAHAAGELPAHSCTCN